ncbi:MAG: DUF3982 domain-containing protein [Bacteroidales bacterium]|nr:DUF3982 domain-containing protein [Bacteroidales bacterium]
MEATLPLMRIPAPKGAR